MNEFPSAPPLVIPTMPEVYHDPLTGVDIPKRLEANLDKRTVLIEACARSSGIASLERELCRKSLLYFLNMWVYTESYFVVDQNNISRVRSTKCYPFITWPKQDELLLAVGNAIDRSEPLLVEKSREVGASWMALMVFLHRWLFSPTNVEFSMLSLKEMDVDNVSGDVNNYPLGTVSDPSTLFGKIDYALRFLPRWMLPRMYRKRLQLVNLDTRSRIDGSASGNFALSSQRRNALLMDEAAKTETFRGIWDGASDVAKCRLPISTPVGMGTFFSELRASGNVKVFEIGWWDDPGKTRDLEVEQVTPNLFRYTSTWYRHEVAHRTSMDVAQNLDIKHLESGHTFFNTLVLKEYARKNVIPPLMQLSIDFRNTLADADINGKLIMKDASAVRARMMPGGPWKLWFDPKGKPLYQTEPDDFPFVANTLGPLIFGIDVSMGTGASHSVISVVNRLSRVKIAEFADANTPPHTLARLTAAACLWFGQALRPLVVVEANGIPGYDFLRQFAKIYRYPSLYCETNPFTRGERVEPSYGFHSSRPKKAALLGNLSRAYSMGNFINQSEWSLKEAEGYIIYEGGGIGPACLSQQTADATATHGDRVIADALAIWPGNEHEAHAQEKRRLAGELTEIPQLNLKAKFPIGSAGWRYQNRATIGLRRVPKSMSKLRPGDRIDLADYG
jgi:hypothetical protein